MGFTPRRRRSTSSKPKGSGKGTTNLAQLRKKMEKNLGLKAPDGKSAATGMEVEARLDALRDND